MRYLARILLLQLAICTFSFVVHAEEKPVIAVANFDFVNTSGEPRDQSREHQERLGEFSAYLRQQLTEGGSAIASLSCQSSQCTATDPGFEALSTMAKQSGASYLVIGIIRKTSTLIGWVEYSVLNVEDNRSVCGDLITYRGDTAESWRRAARFLAAQIASRCGFEADRN